MLKLTRRTNEGLVIQTSDGDIFIGFKLDGKQVRLAIDAPKEVVILRDELLEAPIN